MTIETFSQSQDKTYVKHLQTLVKKNRQKAVLTGLPIFLGKGVAADLGQQACHGPLRDVTYHRVVTWYIVLRAQSWDQGSEEKAQGSEEWNQGSQGF